MFGTLLAMMRLSASRRSRCCRRLRQPDAVGAAGAGDLLVLFPGAVHRPVGHRRLAPIQVGAFVSSLVTFTLFEAAYFGEIMRAGIQSIPRGQVAAAQALGMTYLQTMGYIVLPQAVRNMLPVLLTQTIILFQDTSLVYVLSITDFLGAASKSRSATGAW